MAQEKDEREDEKPENEPQEGQDAPPHEHIEGVDDGCGKQFRRSVLLKNR